MELNISKKNRQWVEKHPSIKKWLNRLAPTTQITYANRTHNFFLWLRDRGGVTWIDDENNEHTAKTPEELLDAQEKLRNRESRERYMILDVIQEYIREYEGRLATKKKTYYQLRSFFIHNRVPLPEDPTFVPKGDLPPVNSTLTLDDIRKLILSCNETYQAVFLIMFQSGMGSKEFFYFNDNLWEQIEPQLDNPLIRIDLPGRKHSRNATPYYTFIGTDAIDALKRYLKTRGKIKDGEAIILNQRNEPILYNAIKRYFNRHAFKIGIAHRQGIDCPKCGAKTIKKIVSTTTRHYKRHNSRTKYTCNECGHVIGGSRKSKKALKHVRYGLGSHELRDLFRSTWEQTPCKGIIAEFFMGHDIDPNNYNKFYKTSADWVEQQYKRAMPWLNIMSEDPRTIPVDEVTHLTDKTKEQNSKISELEAKLQQRDLELEAFKQQLPKIIAETSLQVINKTLTPTLNILTQELLGDKMSKEDELKELTVKDEIVKELMRILKKQFEKSKND